MQPDKYQQAWHAQSSQTRVSVDSNLLLREVQRNQRDFQATIFRRDFLEVGVALLLLPVWFYMGATMALPWTWYLTVPALVWIAGFILVYRMRHRQDRIKPEDPLLRCVQRSLIEVEDQIWLLRNIFWWYLFPPGISIMAFFAHTTWLRSNDWLEALSHSGVFVIFFVICAFIYYLNQAAVRMQLEPRRRELLSLRASLEDETTREEDYATVRNTEAKDGRSKSERSLIVAVSIFVTVAVIALASGLFDSKYKKAPRSSGPVGDSLATLVADLREEKNLVGLAAMVTVDGQLVAAAADGERSKGSGVPVEISDLWHLGGVTKSITATMIARLVESGQIEWSDTVGETFPDADIHEDWKPVTLRQLLTDAAGAPANFSLDVRRKQPPLGAERTQARREAALGVMADKPESPPGERFAYSNVGYSIAGAMVEQMTGETWEDLVKREVFEPLKLAGAGFGPPKSPDDTLPQPRGHRSSLGRKVSMDDETDNTPIMGPSGSVHMTLEDLSTFATDQLRGNLGEGELLSVETYQLLQTPELKRYAYGWIKERPTAEIPYTFYWHNGSNTMWYSLVVFIPETKMVIAVTSNDGDIQYAEAAAWEIVETCVQQIDVETDPPRWQLPQRTDYAKLSPFAAVRWEDSEPEVKVGDEWFELVSLDGVAASKIVAFSKQTYGDQWRKRFEEDLVELLSRMSHPPEEKVTLVVRSLTSSETSELKDIAMTEENRWAIKAAAQSQEAQVAPEVLQSYEGVYTISPQFALTITFEEDHLMVQGTGQSKLHLSTRTETMFYCNDVDAYLFFVADKNGRAKYVVLHQNGTNQTATRQD